jgi:hypothetical protein
MKKESTTDVQKKMQLALKQNMISHSTEVQESANSKTVKIVEFLEPLEAHMLAIAFSDQEEFLGAARLCDALSEATYFKENFVHSTDGMKSILKAVNNLRLNESEVHDEIFKDKLEKYEKGSSGLINNSLINKIINSPEAIKLIIYQLSGSLSEADNQLPGIEKINHILKMDSNDAEKLKPHDKLKIIKNNKIAQSLYDLNVEMLDKRKFVSSILQACDAEQEDLQFLEGELSLEINPKYKLSYHIENIFSYNLKKLANPEKIDSPSMRIEYCISGNKFFAHGFAGESVYGKNYITNLHRAFGFQKEENYQTQTTNPKQKNFAIAQGQDGKYSYVRFGFFDKGPIATSILLDESQQGTTITPTMGKTGEIKIEWQNGVTEKVFPSKSQVLSDKVNEVSGKLNNSQKEFTEVLAQIFKEMQIQKDIEKISNLANIDPNTIEQVIIQPCSIASTGGKIIETEFDKRHDTVSSDLIKILKIQLNQYEPKVEHDQIPQHAAHNMTQCKDIASYIRDFNNELPNNIKDRIEEVFAKYDDMNPSKIALFIKLKQFPKEKLCDALEQNGSYDDENSDFIIDTVNISKILQLLGNQENNMQE